MERRKNVGITYTVHCTVGTELRKIRDNSAPSFTEPTVLACTVY